MSREWISLNAMTASLNDRRTEGEIVNSLRTVFGRDILSRFSKAVREFGLIRDGDRVAVCVSGGMDSALMAALTKELSERGEFDFETVYLSLDGGYDPEARRRTEELFGRIGVPLTFFEADIFRYAQKDSRPCFICSKMRRGHLYAEAKRRGCNKIALGHHFDDVIETILMGMLYGGQVGTMLPRLRSENYEGMELIRPLYYIRKKDIQRWSEHNGLDFGGCGCGLERSDGKRLRVRELIGELAAENPQVEKNIFRSVENVDLKKIVSYKAEDRTYNFMERF